MWALCKKKKYRQTKMSSYKLTHKAHTLRMEWITLLAHAHLWGRRCDRFVPAVATVSISLWTENFAVRPWQHDMMTQTQPAEGGWGWGCWWWFIWPHPLKHMHCLFSLLDTSPLKELILEQYIKLYSSAWDFLSKFGVLHFVPTKVPPGWKTFLPFT